MLPDSLGDFVTSIGANVYVPNIRHDSEAVNLNAEFGLGAFYNGEVDTVSAIVGPRSVDLGGVTGEVGLYRVLDTRTDLRLRSIEFDASMRRKDGSFIIGFANTGEDRNLFVLAHLVLPSGKAMYSLAPVLASSERKPVIEPVFKPVVSNRQDGTDPVDGIVNISVVINEAEMHDVLHLDFSSPEPVRYGDATVAYAGGGNRYLVTDTGPLLQPIDLAPWTAEAQTMIEPAGGNVFGGCALQTPAYKYDDKLVVSISDMTLAGFTETFKSIRGVNVNQRTTSWEFVFDAVSCSGESLSGSAFVEFAPQVEATCRIGLRMFDGAGNPLRDVFAPVPQSALNVYGVSWVKAASAAAIPGTVSIVIRVDGIGPGETVNIVTGFPQIENNTSISTRSTGVKAADVVTCTPAYTMDPSYGRFDITLTPNYEGLPGAYGPQIFFDTRDAQGLNGFYLGHQPTGLLEFGCADSTGAVFVRSASAIQLSGKTKITCFWDEANRNMRIDVDGSIAVDKNLNAITLPDNLNVIRFGTRYSSENRGSFQLHEFTHAQTQD